MAEDSELSTLTKSMAALHAAPSKAAHCSEPRGAFFLEGLAGTFGRSHMQVTGPSAFPSDFAQSRIGVVGMSLSDLTIFSVDVLYLMKCGALRWAS